MSIVGRQQKIWSAYLGVALGDALGWPNEARARRAGSSTSAPIKDLISWSRLTGGRFHLHEEPIEQGAYSDDTQLFLCTLRSLLRGGRDWWPRLAFVEFPTWLSYERGAGSAVKKAAQALSKGRFRWQENSKDRFAYFQAGGNGVAMRILPHAVLTRDSTFDEVRDSIVQNGIITHGHPRALLGALCYGYAVWSAIHKSSTVGYGELISDLKGNLAQWSAFPLNLSKEWLTAAEHALGRPYQVLWDETAVEMDFLLQVCEQALLQGSISLDGDVLDALGAFNKEINGAGTVSAAAAIYMASRYAVDPLNGVLNSATAVGTDSDTLASMVGGLLGVLVGHEWPSGLIDRLQDRDYLIWLASHIDGSNPVLYSEYPRSVRSAAVSRFEKSLERRHPGDKVIFPDGRSGYIKRTIELHSRVKSSQASLREIVLDDGQTVFVKTIRKSPDHQGPKSVEATFVPRVETVGLRLYVRNLERALEFYTSSLGLTVTRKTSGASATLNGVLQLIQQSSASVNGELSLGHENFYRLYVDTPDLDKVYGTMKARHALISEMRETSTRRFFVCRDPDNHPIEVSFSALDQR